jgi:ribosomal-protein-alanine N-acetyltransferase
MIAFLPRPRVFLEEAGAADADAMAEIHGHAFARAWSPFDFASLVAQPAVFALGARRESPFRPRRLVGFVLVRSAADEAEILTIAVRPSSRRRGLGRSLMEEALRRLYRDRIASCFLEVDPGNEAAIGLYTSLGFAVVGERKGYYLRAEGAAAPALVMRVQLR